MMMKIASLILSLCALAYLSLYGYTVYICASGAQENETYRQSLRRKDPNVHFVAAGDRHSELKLGIAAYFDDNFSICETIQRPYIQRAPEQDVSGSVSSCKRAYNDIRVLSGAQRTHSPIECEIQLSLYSLPISRYFLPNTDLCREAVKSANLKYVLAAYFHSFTQGEPRNGAQRYGFRNEFAEDNQRLLEYFGELQSERLPLQMREKLNELERETARCREIQNANLRNACYQVAAVSLKDPSLCQNIPNAVDSYYDSAGLIRDFCYIAIARETKDDSLCENVSADSESISRDYCLQSVAIASNDTIKCEALSLPYRRAACQKQVSPTLGMFEQFFHCLQRCFPGGACAGS